jgi:hypothetical protein
MYIKKIKLLICFIFIFFSISPFISFAEEKGSVYLGPFLSVVYYKPGTMPYLTIGDYGPFRFENKDQISKPVTDELDLKIIYKVKVHYDGEVVSSWDLNFDKFGDSKVCIWRAKGSWRMEPMENSKCQCQD